MVQCAMERGRDCCYIGEAIAYDKKLMLERKASTSRLKKEKGSEKANRHVPIRCDGGDVRAGCGIIWREAA